MLRPGRGNTILLLRDPATMHILVADDDPSNRELLTELLRNSGHSVTTVADGREALAAIAGGQFEVVLGGSFEPGKLFTVAAYVQDPAQGQTLSLEMPKGMQRIEGKERQPVPEVDEDGNAMVMWKGRVENVGRFPLRIHSSTGVTQTKIVAITPLEKNK